jgi:uncharacterized membrane protein
MFVNLKEISIKLADKIAAFIGSWKFIIIQSTILTIWIVINSIGLVHYDPFPFILLNLFLSFEAAYATPLILMSATRQADKDREHLLHDVELDQNAYNLMLQLNEILIELKEDLRIDEKSLEDHAKLKEDHSQLQKELEDIKKLLQK